MSTQKKLRVSGIYLHDNNPIGDMDYVKTILVVELRKLGITNIKFSDE
jgi:hypothetical protein